MIKSKGWGELYLQMFVEMPFRLITVSNSSQLISANPFYLKKLRKRKVIYLNATDFRRSDATINLIKKPA